MGCGGSKDVDVKDGKKKNGTGNVTPNLIVKKFTGNLADDSNFQHCLIKNEEELENHLRQFIPTDKKNSNGTYEKNTEDEILTRSFQFDFSKHVVLVFKGISIFKVYKDGDLFAVRQGVKKVEDYHYTAVYVTVPEGIKHEFVLKPAIAKKKKVGDREQEEDQDEEEEEAVEQNENKEGNEEHDNNQQGNEQGNDQGNEQGNDNQQDGGNQEGDAGNDGGDRVAGDE